MGTLTHVPSSQLAKTSRRQKAIFRPKSIGAKVAGEEYARLDEMAAAAGRSCAGWVRDISLRTPIHNEFFADMKAFKLNRFAGLLIRFYKLKWAAITADRGSLKSEQKTICRDVDIRDRGQLSAGAPVATRNFSKRTQEVVETIASQKKTNPGRVPGLRSHESDGAPSGPPTLACSVGIPLDSLWPTQKSVGTNAARHAGSVRHGDGSSQLPRTAGMHGRHRSTPHVIDAIRFASDAGTSNLRYIF